MRKLYTTGVVFVILFFFACKENTTEIAKQIKATSNLDSARILLEKYPSNEVAYAFYLNVKKLCQENADTQLSNRYIGALFHLAAQQNNTYIINLAEQCKTIQQFLVGNAMQSQFWAQEMLRSAQKEPLIDILDNYHLAGIAYYSSSNTIDSTLKYWKLGFQTAVEKNDEYRIYFFANNLGAIFYELDMYVIAGEFFLKALNQAKLTNTVSPVLVNNILNTLVEAENFTDAIEFYKENKSMFEVDPSIFQNQSVYLNSIVINQRLQQFNKSDSLIRAFDLSKIHESLKSQYISIHIRQFVNTLDTYFINFEIQNEARKQGIGLLHTLKKKLRELNMPELGFLWEIIESDVNKSLANVGSNRNKGRQLLFALDLLIQRYKTKNTQKHLKYQLAYSEVSRVFLSTDAEINHYIMEVKRVDDLFDKLIVRNKELDFQRSNMRYLGVLLLLLLVILVISVLYLRKRIQLKQNEQEILLKEKDLLVRENTMNNRIIEFSKELVEFNKKIKAELDNINFNGNNTEFLRKFKSELLGFVTINLEQNPKAVDYTFDQATKEKNVDEEDWVRLNKTEKRVYMLFKEGFKANEISGMLGVSTQYVYNTKTRMKSKGIDVD